MYIFKQDPILLCRAGQQATGTDNTERGLLGTKRIKPNYTIPLDIHRKIPDHSLKTRKQQKETRSGNKEKPDLKNAHYEKGQRDNCQTKNLRSNEQANCLHHT